MAEDNKIPACIGIIMDGNRRWAKLNNLSSLEGHHRGLDRLKEAARWVRDRGVKHLAVYAFSTENWNRDETEVSYLLKLFRTAMEELFTDLAEDDIRIRFVGERACFDDNIAKAMSRVEEKSSQNDKLTLWVCLSYGGRSEIVSASNLASREGVITEETLAEHLWTVGMPDPDIVIRTGGEKRLSGFLTWQSIYSELFFVDNYWPDFSESILDSVLNEYTQRNRRLGR